MSRLRALPVPAAVYVGLLLVGCVGLVVMVAAASLGVNGRGSRRFRLGGAVAGRRGREGLLAGSRWPPLVGAVSYVVILVGAFVSRADPAPGEGDDGGGSADQAGALPVARESAMSIPDMVSLRRRVSRRTRPA